MECDDKVRAEKGLAVCLRDMGNGKSRIFIDDILSENTENPITWKFDTFYTFTPEFFNGSIDEMSLTEDDFANIGAAVVARLLALNSRAK
ncbi:hypothetical protein NBRC116493_13390 [Aurantivibrio infirmus]